jgi:Rieske Fe-S protein
MQRRTFLIWLGRAVYTTCAAAVAVPVARFLAAPAATPAGGGSLRRRVARLDALPVGEPQLLSVVGTRQDGWTRHAEQVVGRVWVTRKGPAGAPPSEAKLTVFNVACPHNGCPIQQAAERGFACHCHGACFTPDGERIPINSNGRKNPSLRGMDPLPHAVVKDEATGQWWVEVEYKEYETGLAHRIEKA